MKQNIKTPTRRLKTHTLIPHSRQRWLFHFSLSFLSCSHIPKAAVQDFCVADYTVPASPAGYACKNPANVTADDFVYSGLRKPRNTSNVLNISVLSGFDSDFPGVNGLGVSAARVEIAVGGAVPLHSHPAGSELLLVAKGTITAGFISSTNTVYSKTLKRGDIIVFPQGLLHFQVNKCRTPATVFLSFGSQNPGLQLLEFVLFTNDLPTEVIAATTFLDVHQIKKLKGVFGGTN